MFKKRVLELVSRQSRQKQCEKVEVVQLATLLNAHASLFSICCSFVLFLCQSTSEQDSSLPWLMKVRKTYFKIFSLHSNHEHNFIYCYVFRHATDKREPRIPDRKILIFVNGFCFRLFLSFSACQN